MTWVVNRRKQRLRDAALRHLNLAFDRIDGAIEREETIEGRARTALGPNHALGDQIIADMTRAVTSCGFAQEAISRAISEANRIDIMVWVDD